MKRLLAAFLLLMVAVHSVDVAAHALESQNQGYERLAADADQAELEASDPHKPVFHVHHSHCDKGCSGSASPEASPAGGSSQYWPLDLGLIADAYLDGLKRPPKHLL
jgi:hypothetical protein